MLITVSAAAAASKEPSEDGKIKIKVLRSFVTSITRTSKTAKTAKPKIAASQLKPFQEHIFCPLTSHALIAALVKTGIRSGTDLVKAANTFFTKTDDAERKALTSKLITELTKTLLSKFSVYVEVSSVVRSKDAKTGRISYKRSKRNVAVAQTKLRPVVESYAMAYVYAAMRLCAAYGVKADYATVAKYLIFGTPLAGVPKEVKTALSKKNIGKPDTTADAIPDSLTAEKLKPLHFKKYGHALISALPKLIKDYVEANYVKPKPSKEKLLYRRRYLDAQNLKKAKQAAIDSLIDKMNPEVVAMIKLSQPKLLPQAKAVEPAKIKTLKQDIKSMNWKIARYPAGGAMATVAAKKLKLLQAKLKALLAENAPAKESYDLKPWMVPFVDSKVSLTTGGKPVRVKIDDGILIHRLVQRANTNKLKADDKELEVTLDEASSVLLTYVGADRIVDCIGSSIKAFKGIFKECADTVKPKLFVARLTEKTSTNSVNMPTGRVTDKKLLRLNNITDELKDSVMKQYAKQFKAWDVTKVEVDTFIDGHVGSKEAKASRYTVKEVNAATLKKWKTEVKSKMAYAHNVDVEIQKAWEVEPSPALKKLLAGANKSTLNVVPNVFHGTSRQAGSIILHCGFKIQGTMKTARSMGDVLYIAPNIDKSAQYLGSNGFTRAEGVIGLIFFGDAVVEGSPSGKAGLARTKSIVTNPKYRWTKTTGFKTEEIGLVSPNDQFIIRRVYLVKCTKLTAKPKLNNVATKFEPLIPLSSYSHSS
jgi:hypothetical protein